MSLEIMRLHLASLRGVDGRDWPVHGFVVTHPGGALLVDWHTAGHQCVVVRSGDDGPDVLIGDAAYTPRQYRGPDGRPLPPGQASDPATWRESLRRIRSMSPARVHFCHHTEVIHS